MTNPSTYIEGHGVFTAYGFQPHSSYPAWQAFDHTGNLSSVWYSDGLSEYSGTGDYSGSTQLAPETVKGAYIVLEMPYEIVLKQIKFWQQFGGSHVWDRGVYYAKCNPSDEWTAIHNVTDRPVDDDTPYVAYITDSRPYKYFAVVITRRYSAHTTNGVSIRDLQFFGTPGPTTLDKGSLSLTRSLDVPRISRYDVDTETPRPEKLILDFDTTVNSSPTDISGKGNHGTFNGNTVYSAPDKAFKFDGEDAGPADYIIGNLNNTGDTDFTVSLWLKKDRSGTAGLLWNFGGSGGSGNPEDSVAVQVTSGDRLDFFIFSGAKIEISNFGVDYLNKWVHIVATRTGIDLKIYLDGVDQNLSITGSEPTHTLQLAANTEYTIGARGTGSLGTDSLSGYISNFKVYDVVLEPSEVKKLYNLGRTGRSMVISDTAVGIGKAPEAQLDVRGSINATGSISSNNPSFSYWKVNSEGLETTVESPSGTVQTAGFFQNFATNFGQNHENGASYENRNSMFDPDSGTFYVPEKGLYQLTFNFTMVDSASNNRGDETLHMSFQILNNGSYETRLTTTSALQSFNPALTTGPSLEEFWCLSECVLLDTGANVRVYIQNIDSGNEFSVNKMNFSGFKIA
jgi:hypothetical protein